MGPPVFIPAVARAGDEGEVLRRQSEGRTVTVLMRECDGILALGLCERGQAPCRDSRMRGRVTHTQRRRTVPSISLEC